MLQDMTAAVKAAVAVAVALRLRRRTSCLRCAQLLHFGWRAAGLAQMVQVVVEARVRRWKGRSRQAEVGRQRHKGLQLQLARGRDGKTSSSNNRNSRHRRRRKLVPAAPALRLLSQ